MTRIGLLIMLFLTACDTPQVGFKYDTQHTLTVGRNTFKVFYNQTHAQAVRLNRIQLRETDQVAADVVIAIETVTGCKIRRGSMRGDPTLIIVRLKQC